MLNYPAGWDEALNTLFRMETKVSIAGVEYDESEIVSVSTRAALFAGDTISIGGCVAKEIDLVVAPKGEIPRMAEIKVFVRPVVESIETEWLQKGVYYIDTRKEDRVYGILTIHGYDSMLKAEQTFLSEIDAENWPRLMQDVADDIAERIGVKLDARTEINGAFTMGHPADLTLREILGYIAAANAGNWVINDAGDLRLVPLSSQTDAPLDIGVNATSLEVSPPLPTFSGVRLWTDDEKSVFAGDETSRVLAAKCPWATQEIADYVLSAVSDRVYQPFSAQGAVLSAVAELGDLVQIDGVESIVGFANTVFDAMSLSDIGAPAEEELDHEYPYVAKQQREITRNIGELRSEILKTADSITLLIRKDEVISAINLSKEGVSIKGDRISLEGHISANGTFEIDKDGFMKATGGEIGGWTIKDNCLQSTAETYLDPGQEELDTIRSHIMGIVELPAESLPLYDFNGDGAVNVTDYMTVKEIMLGRRNFETCANAQKGQVTVTVNPADPIKTICISGMNMWGRSVEIFFGANVNRSTIATKDHVQTVVNDALTSAAVEVWSGEFQSGSISFPDSTEYSMYLIVGIPGSGMARVSLLLPKAVITEEDVLYQITDEVSYFSFHVKTDGSTVTLTSSYNQNNGTVYNVFGIR